MSYHYQVRGIRLPGEDSTIVPTRTREEADAAIETLKGSATVNKVELWHRPNIFRPWEEVESARWVRTRPHIAVESRRVLAIADALQKEQFAFYHRVCDAVEGAAATHGVSQEAAQAIIDAITAEFKKG